MMITMVGCILASVTSKVISSGDYDDDDGWLYHCLMPQQHRKSSRGSDHDDNDGWLYHCLMPQQHLRSSKVIPRQ